MIEELRYNEHVLKSKFKCLDSCVMSWKFTNKDTEDQRKLLEGKVKSLEEGKSLLRQQLQTQKLHNEAKLDSLLESNDEAFRKYREDTTKNLTEAMPKLNANLVLHA
ncbi:hypothetical protein J1N35_005406 [Gossypium stocksii]|uniref:Uncharacterized protein n=1 Tax=Gossypium stocksii TaxID=47602 RepID=A0A9D3WDR2_9ROSI|nr:hypothetical protein J1N35_005406 [Gossypium stocksii]